MKRPPTSTPKPGTPTPGEQGSGRKPHDPLARLDADLAAMEASRRKAPRGVGSEAGAGYRLLGQMLGGVLGGIGLGWLVDHYAHTSPWGLVIGLLIGSGLSIYSTVRTATRMGARAQTRTGPAASVPDDDDDV